MAKSPALTPSNETRRIQLSQYLYERWMLWWQVIYLGSLMLALILHPKSHQRLLWISVAKEVYQRIIGSLIVFSLVIAILSAIITSIAAELLRKYGLSQLITPLMVRFLLNEFVPFVAALVAAMKLTITLGTDLALLRQKGHIEKLNAVNADALHAEFLPRFLIGLYAAILMLVVSTITALLAIYVGIYGFKSAAWPIFTHQVGRTITPFISSVYLLKVTLFCYVIALAPLVTASFDIRFGFRSDSQLSTLSRILILLVSIETFALVINHL